MAKSINERMKELLARQKVDAADAGRAAQDTKEPVTSGDPQRREPRVQTAAERQAWVEEENGKLRSLGYLPAREGGEDRRLELVKMAAKAVITSTSREDVVAAMVADLKDPQTNGFGMIYGPMVWTACHSLAFFIVFGQSGAIRDALKADSASAYNTQVRINEKSEEARQQFTEARRLLAAALHAAKRMERDYEYLIRFIVVKAVNLAIPKKGDEKVHPSDNELLTAAQAVQDIFDRGEADMPDPTPAKQPFDEFGFTSFERNLSDALAEELDIR